MLIKSFISFKKNEQGSFTLEASLIFPIIILLTILFILISIYIYEKVYLYYIATQAAERSTYNWSNSYKDPYSGQYNIGEYDNLYWRFTEKNVSIDIPVKDKDNNLSLAERKLISVAREIPSGINGSMTYTNKLYERNVTVSLESPINIPENIGKLIGNSISTTSKSTITEPVEFIRTIDLIRYNSDKLDNITNYRDILNKK